MNKKTHNSNIGKSAAAPKVQTLESAARLYMSRVKTNQWGRMESPYSDELKDVAHLLKANGVDYSKFVRAASCYIDWWNEPGGDYDTGNPHREAEAMAQQYARQRYEEACADLGVSTSTMSEILSNARRR